MSAPAVVRVLCAEDDPTTARLMQRRLERAGYAVDVAADGLAALSAWERGAYDILTLDQFMPGMTGLEVLRQLASRGPLPPTLMITGAGDEMIAIEALSLGADDYLIKDPEISFLDLVPEMIERTLRKRQLLADNGTVESESGGLERFFRDSFKYAPVGLYHESLDGGLIRANQALCDFLRYSAEDLADLPHMAITHSDYVEQSLANSAALLDGKIDRISMDKLYIRGDKSVVWAHLTASLVRDSQGQPEYVIGVVQDISERKEAEKTDSLSRQDWERTFDSVPDPLMILDMNQRIIKANKPTAEKLGLSMEDLVGAHCYELFHGLPHPHGGCPCVKLMHDACHHEIELVDNRLGGTFHVSVTPLTDSKGELIGCVHLARDITERKKMDQTLAERLEELRKANRELDALLRCSKALLESQDFSEAAKHIFEVAKAYTGARTGYVTMLKSPAEDEEALVVDAAGRPFTVDPGIAMPINGLAAKVCMSRRTEFENDSDDTDCSSNLHEGRLSPHNVLYAPLIMGDRPMGLLVLGDKPGGFTEEDSRLCTAFAGFAAVGLFRSLAEEALRESEVRFRAIAENIEEAFWLTVAGNLRRLAYVSPAYEKLWGRDKDLFLSDPTTWAKSLHPEDRDAAVVAYSEFIQGNSAFDVEYRIVRPDGSIRWIWDRGFLVREIAGKASCVAGVAQDITQRKIDQEMQANLMDEIRNFAYIVSHDLRSPLVNMAGFCGELESARKSLRPAVEIALNNLPPVQRDQVQVAFEQDFPEAIKYIRSSVTRMDRLISAILKLSRLGHSELTLGPVNMQELVSELVNASAHQIREKGLNVTVGVLPDTIADQIAMEQIVGNLLENAIKYLDSSRTGEISVVGWRQGREDVFQIKDNGIGVAKKDRERIFQVFQRSGNTEVQGEGMGLAYVRALVRRHGGRIWCESKVGAGSTFTFTIAQRSGEVSGICLPCGRSAFSRDALPK